ncbi:MAG: 2,3-bisphosphoglycerate-independent phosphoglycerate mutase [Holophagae bacterium]|jgi:2,3-bisphosphoglycerate-independent phosphoglycerate mutase
MIDFTLRPNPRFGGIQGPLLLVILDGVGLYRGRSEGYPANAFDLAETPNLDRLMSTAPVRLELAAHGTAVGMPNDGDMGNSEVGHNAMGAGRVFAQGAKLVSDAITSGALFAGDTWRDLVRHVAGSGSTFHLIGLLSDGNVHSHIDHLEAMLRRLAVDGVARVRVHALADGRDVDPVTYHLYVKRLEGVLGELRADGCDAAIASGGGRMAITMDRYNADWDMVRRGWETHVLGRARGFRSAQEAIETLRSENPGVIDQDLPPFVIQDADGHPIGTVEDGDAVVFFNFRGDRAIEISRAFTDDDFRYFDRVRRPDIHYAGMMEYDGDLGIPPRYLVEPPAIDRTVSEYLVHNGVAQLATAETQKFGHVTYFWNGNNSEKFDPDLEDWIEVQSDRVSFDQAPAMKAREVCQVVLDALDGRAYRFLRVNFANGDMVGHTGVLDAAVSAMEVVDECVGRLHSAVGDVGGTMIVTADHGNLDMMAEVDPATGQVKRGPDGELVAKTSHTLSPVPWLLTGVDADRFAPNPAVDHPGLGNIASTILVLLGFDAPDDYLPPLVIPDSTP